MDTQSRGFTLPPPPPVADEEGSSKGPKTNEGGRPIFYGDMLRQMAMKNNDVKLTVVIDKGYRPLFEAALKGKWKVAERIINEKREAIEATVMEIERKTYTVLDVAVMAAQDQFVEKLVKLFNREESVSSLTRALTNAVRRDRIRMVKTLVEKVYRPTKSTAHSTEDPIFSVLCDVAVYASTQKEAIWYLARHTTSVPDYLTLGFLIAAGYMDIALHLARREPSSAISEDTPNEAILESLRSMKFYYCGGDSLNFWEKYIYKCIPLSLVDASYDISKDMKMNPVVIELNRLKISLWNLAIKPAPFLKRIGESKWRNKCSLEFVNLIFNEKKKKKEVGGDIDTTKVLELLLTSGIVREFASRGISEVVSLCFEHFPELIWEKKFIKELMQEAVNGRHVELFRLVNAHKKITEICESYNMNHQLMEAFIKSPPGCVLTDVSGATFLMQREIQWYQVLEDMIDPSTKCYKLTDTKKTNWESFVEKRQDLLKEAGQWIKDTSSSCSVVATLIITVAFAAAFTVPGGNNSSTGIPIFLKRGSFTVFAIADVLALFSSVTATLMFLAILTSRYAMEDFLLSLPRKLVLGFTFLFLSLAFMLVAFSSALTIILIERWKWTYIPITLLAACPIVLFAILQLPLYVEMVKSTYWPPLYRPLKLWK